MKRPRIRDLVLGGLVAVAAAISITGLACTQKDDADRTDRPVTALPGPDDVDVVDEELMIALAQAKNFHHKADVYLQEGMVDEAIEAVREILGVPFPEAPEAEDVVLDARARLAKLLVTAGKIDDAMAVVESGIAASTRDSFFLANLYTVKGEVHEARAVLVAESDEEAAKSARRAAIEAYDRSIEINEALQKKLMRERGE